MSNLPRRSPMGMDPNYRGGVYRGQRFREEGDDAAYGRYRAEHGRDLDAAGGPRGRYTGAGKLRDPGPSRPSGPIAPPRLRSPERYRGRPTGDSVPAQPIRGGGYGYGGYGSRGGGDAAWRPFDRGGRDGGGRGGGGRGGGGRGGAGRGGDPGSRSRQRGGARSRYDQLDASRPLRYDRGFERYSGFGRGGFSEG